jgi:5'-3' exonuclease
MLLVIDIESYIFRACTACKTLVQDTKNKYIYTESYDLRKGMEYIANFIEDLKAKFLTNDVVLVVGDKNNWRKQYHPDYKANRKDKEKPPMYDIILNEMYNIYNIQSLSNLEADDTCRIIYEDNKTFPTRKILVSIDKDFHSFPCELYDPLHDKQYVINEAEADYNLMKQIIMGDKADNIQGLDGYGEVKTTKFLDDEPRILEDVRQLFKEKGQLKDFIINLNLVSMVSLDRYNFNTGEVKEYS